MEKYAKQDQIVKYWFKHQGFDCYVIFANQDPEEDINFRYNFDFFSGTKKASEIIESSYRAEDVATVEILFDIQQ